MAVLKYKDPETGEVMIVGVPKDEVQSVETTMLASNWVGNTYSFEADYPHAQYNIEVGVAKTATVEQFDAFCEARIGEDTGSNVAVAVGDVPTVDIPVVIKAVRK